MNTPASDGFGNYSSARYDAFDGIHRLSEYVGVRDGTKLAVDMYISCAPDTVPGDRLPFLLAFTCYHRAFLHEGTIHGLLDPPMGMMFSYLHPMLEGPDMVYAWLT